MFYLYICKGLNVSTPRSQGRLDPGVDISETWV